MKIYIYLIILMLSNCTQKKYIVMPNVKGEIYSKVDNKPITKVKFFVSKYAFNALADTVKTDNNGYFFYNGIFVDSYSDLRFYSTTTQHIFFLEKNKVYKYLDVKKKYNKDDYNKKETIDLGIIYFEDLKSIKRDSIPE